MPKGSAKSRLAIRLPSDVKGWLETQALDQHSSLNAVVVLNIRAAMAFGRKPEQSASRDNVVDASGMRENALILSVESDRYVGTLALVSKSTAPNRRNKS